jgi:ATP-dependent DNA helicase RecQ
VDDGKDLILEALRTLTAKPDANFHVGQREAIESLVDRRERLVLVQRTGWGKSAVYFVATDLLRAQGLGPTLLISPLLALIRNQIDAAKRLGLRTFTINSDSESTVSELVSLIDSDEVDLVVISPERLANPEFAEKIMPRIGRRPGLTVVDEVHCISDWGHDFRPDYRRIGKMLSSFPEGLPILGCTATANNRVMEDAREQLGATAVIQRGSLTREGLALGVLDLPNPLDRLAWLSTYLPTLPGSGIVYCLTTRDVDIVTSWLQLAGLSARAHHAGIASKDKLEAEQMLLDGSLKILVATTALGMGYDNPAIGFVVHYQSPGSVVHYYQQVGRAGRVLSSSKGVMLRGDEDEKIISWFINSAFPSKSEAEKVLNVLDSADGSVSIHQVAEKVNLHFKRIENVLKQLDIAGVIRRVGWQKYERTLSKWEYPTSHVAELTQIRLGELKEMREYARDLGCRMAFLARALDDVTFDKCGICDNCTGQTMPSVLDPETVQSAQQFLNKQFGQISPRLQDHFGRYIPASERLAEGRYLCRWGDAGYGKLVRRGKEVDGNFDDGLVTALTQVIRHWAPNPAPTAITFVPSDRHPLLVAGLAQRLANEMSLPLLDILEKTRHTEAQKSMKNSAHQARNVEGAFAIKKSAKLPVVLGPVLLLDDMVDSKWTMTEIGRVLRRAGFPIVYPLALANSFS